MTAYVMEEIPKRCPRCGSAHVVKVTRHSPDRRAWMCRGCFADVDVPAEVAEGRQARSLSDAVDPVLEEGRRMRYLIAIEADVNVDAENVLEAVTKAHAMLQALRGVGETRIVRVHEIPEVRG